MAAPTSKKAKIEDDGWMDRIWQHHRDYIDSCEDDQVGDVDEIPELLKEIPARFRDVRISDLRELKDRESLLPALISVSHGSLADHELSQLLLLDAQSPDRLAHQEALKHHITASLVAFPFNAQTWSMTANLCRTDDVQQWPRANVVQAYSKAAESAKRVRDFAIDWLKNNNDAMLCEWIEMLLLNQVVGVEWLEDEGTEENEEEVDEENGSWSQSPVEAVSRFMASMLHSMMGNHEEARQQMKPFGFTHRLHPSVWAGDTTSSSSSATTVARVQNVLPDKIHSRLLQVFAPDADYWKESGYGSRGYYSYFEPLSSDTDHVIRHVVETHLLPLVRAYLGEKAQQICGYEWWVHTRPTTANLGHQLHFDTDELLLRENEPRISHPLVSSVLYLSGAGKGCGSTIVFDQTPDSETVASSVWLNTPIDNSLLMFPGNQLHGVLPCTGYIQSGECASIHPDKLFDVEAPKSTNPDDAATNRLTLMVGFWSRNIPEDLETKPFLYGPCGPLPPQTEHTWVKQIHEEFDQMKPLTKLSVDAVPSVVPAWEELSASDETENLLEVPQRVDHRFFVHDAPHCFRKSLFDHDEFDEIH